MFVVWVSLCCVYGFRASIRQHILDLLSNRLCRLLQISAKHCRLVSVPPLISKILQNIVSTNNSRTLLPTLMPFLSFSDNLLHDTHICQKSVSIFEIVHVHSMLNFILTSLPPSNSQNVRVFTYTDTKGIKVCLYFFLCLHHFCSEVLCAALCFQCVKVHGKKVSCTVLSQV